MDDNKLLNFLSNPFFKSCAMTASPKLNKFLSNSPLNQKIETPTKRDREFPEETLESSKKFE